MGPGSRVEIITDWGHMGNFFSNRGTVLDSSRHISRAVLVKFDALHIGVPPYISWIELKDLKSVSSLESLAEAADD